MEAEWGGWAAAVEQNLGPQLPSLRLIQPSDRCICTDSPPAPPADRRRIPLYVVPIPTCADRWNASAVLSVPRFLTVRTCVWARFEKFRRTIVRIARRACPRLHRA